ncbi:hypothetical protein [Alcanivorax profundi]|uniref:hypothetical protein n=1 Tax=Alcanivorax profundi TaxID=2338368 RepID=UPI0032B30854
MTDYQLIRSKRRSLELRVLEDGRVQVRAPQRTPLRMSNWRHRKTLLEQPLFQP